MATNCAAHRKAQAKYVAKNPGKQRAAAKAHYQKNASKIKNQKRAARKSSGGKTSSKQGRPRTC